MKLFYYDAKHENLLAQMEIGDADIKTVKKVIEFLRSNGVIDQRYKALTVAQSCDKVYNEDYEESELVFN